MLLWTPSFVCCCAELSHVQNAFPLSNAAAASWQAFHSCQQSQTQNSSQSSQQHRIRQANCNSSTNTNTEPLCSHHVAINTPPKHKRTSSYAMYNSPVNQLKQLHAAFHAPA
jgi:hypothetical protein